MANTYSQLHVQTVFAVKRRNALLMSAWRFEVLGVIGQLINRNKCTTFIVNGVDDHVHCFFGLHPSISISALMKNVKSLSSKYINESKLTANRFEWQKGYAAFSYHHSFKNYIYEYVLNQEKHHKKVTFREEYLTMLKEFDIQYDNKFIFEDLI